MPVTITEFRAQYPAYDSKTDEELSNALYNKYYAGKLERSDFDAKFLGLPVQSDSILGDEQGDWGITKFAKGATRGVIDAVKGDAEFEDMGNTTAEGIGDTWGGGGASMGERLKLGAAATFGSDSDIKNQLQKVYPDATFSQDANGNEMVSLPDGRQSYINKPGLDIDDVTRFIGKAASFAPAAKIAGAAKTFAGKVIGGGAAAGATDALMQKAAGRESIDEGQVLLSAASGAAGEAIAPIIGKAVQAVKNRAGKRTWEGMTQAQQNRRIAAQFKRDGITVDDLRGLPKEQARALGVNRINEADLVSPEASIASGEFGYQASRGQKMPEGSAQQRAAKFDQLSREEQLRSTPAGQKFRDIDFRNERMTTDNVEDIAGSFSGGQAQASTAMEAAEMVQDGLVKAERSLKSKVDRAYENARSFDANLAGDFAADMPTQIQRKLDDADVIIDDLTPAAANLMGKLNEIGGQIMDGGMRDVPIGQVERWRRQIGRFYDKAANNEDRRAVQIIKNQFDDQLDEAIDARLFVGDEGALDALKDARKLHAEYSAKFRSKDEAGKIVQKMLDIEATPEQIANYMIGVNGLSKAGSGRIAKAYGSIVGKKSPEYNALREMAFLTIARKPTGDAKGSQALVSTLKKAVNGQGSTLMNELYTKAEIATLKRFTLALESTLPSREFARTSGTAERLQRFYNAEAFRTSIFTGPIKELIENYQVAQALRPPSNYTPISGTPAIAGTVSANQE